jgi:hypothetical protein
MAIGWRVMYTSCIAICICLVLAGISRPLNATAPLRATFESTLECLFKRPLRDKTFASMSSAPSDASGAQNPVPAPIPPVSSARLVGSHENVLRSNLLPLILAHRLRQVLDPDSRDASDDDNAHLKDSGRDSKSAALNRKRIVIKPISDERSRVGTYNKRKFGVIKKAMELSILCKCKIGTSDGATSYSLRSAST